MHSPKLKTHNSHEICKKIYKTLKALYQKHVSIFVHLKNVRAANRFISFIAEGLSATNKFPLDSQKNLFPTINGKKLRLTETFFVSNGEKQSVGKAPINLYSLWKRRCKIVL